MSGAEVATLDAVGSEAGWEDQRIDERMRLMRMRLLLLMEMQQAELVLDACCRW
jgi:hypothetical protein